MYDVCMECRNLGSNESWFLIARITCSVLIAVTGCVWHDVECDASDDTATRDVHESMYVHSSFSLPLSTRRGVWSGCSLGLELGLVRLDE
jgi:hypothetical protein